MYNVLHVMSAADAGGISRVVLNYYRAIDRTKIHFDVALTTDSIGLDAEKMKKLGINFFRIPLKSNGIKAYEDALEKLLRSKKYQAIHVHENETSYVALRVAKRAGVPQRIAHAHTSSPYTSIKSELRRLSGCLLNCYYATNMIACGELAGNRVFGKNNMRKKKAVVLPNAIRAEEYCFDPKKRKKIRQELGVEDKFVVGVVGRLSPEKNIAAAIGIAEEYHSKNKVIVMLCVGNGELEEELKNKVSIENAEGYISFLGRRSDVNDLNSAFDVLLMPSIYEGFPVAAVEAIDSGLPVLLSDTITKELAICEGVQYLPLNDKSKWVEALDRIFMSSGQDRTKGVETIRKNRLDIKDTAKELENIYLQFENETNYSDL